MDVIPDTLAVISLNSIYFYDSNKGVWCLLSSLIRRSHLISWLINAPFWLTPFHRPAVGGCEYKQPNDPGNLQLDWLDVQLGVLRDKGIKVSLPHTLPKPQPPVPDQTRGFHICDGYGVLTCARILSGMVDGTRSSDP